MGVWNDEILEHYFIPMDVEVIKMIPISTVLVDEFWAWQFEKTRVFSICSYYRALIHSKKVREDWLEGRQSSSSSTAEQKSWCKIVEVKFPSKVRIFLWRLSHESIPNKIWQSLLSVASVMLPRTIGDTSLSIAPAFSLRSHMITIGGSR
jgi:hypothetical protein